MKCYIRGHRFATLNITQIKRLEKYVKKVIKEYNVDEFIFHHIYILSNKIFQIVSKVLQEYPNIKTTFFSNDKDCKIVKLKSQKVKSNNKSPDMFVDKIKYFEVNYHYPKCDILLNYHIIDNVNICIFLFDHKIIKNRAGVTAHAYDYALKKKKIVFNIAYK